VKAAPDCVKGSCRPRCGTRFCCKDGIHLAFGDDCDEAKASQCPPFSPKDSYEGEAKNDTEATAYPINDFEPQDPCRLSLDVVGANLHSPTDVDWYCFQTAVADCTHAPTFVFTPGFDIEVVVRCWAKDEIVHHRINGDATCTPIPPDGLLEGNGLSCKADAVISFKDLKCGSPDGLPETLSNGVKVCMRVSKGAEVCPPWQYGITVR